ncbi:hypothetical protein PMAC_002763 [Pneumocystis sp. 'macacae']|nr:hypothetical protein PMAC_002763 [Pneumocystis sp. 'macacae']
MEEKDYSNMTVPELKVICRTLGLRVKGRKSELIKRIQDKNEENVAKDGSELKILKANTQSIQNIQNIQNIQDVQKEGLEPTVLKTNVLNIQKKEVEVLNKSDSALKNNPKVLKMNLIKKDESKIVLKNFKRKPDTEESKIPENIVDINKEKQEYSSHINSNVSRKLRKVVIKFVKKESLPIADQPKPLIHQIINVVPDSNISASGIGKSPSLALRGKINIYARLFARLAFCLPSSERYAFLYNLALVCKLWNFSVKFAWHQLILLEFPGKRTETWISTVDPTIHSLRLWYIHRQTEKQRTLKIFKQSWIERLFRIYGQTFSCNYFVSQRELWFFGICYNLLSDPDQKGQWEVAVRFWMFRFVLRMMNGESWKSWAFFFDEVYNDMIVAVKRVGMSDIWRIESLNNKVWYISGQSGEAIGWNSSPCSHDTINIENITWKDLRFDWKTYISKIINNDSPSDLFDCVFYHGDTSLYPRGIHKNINDPLRFSLAKRFVLSHIIEYSISGLYESRPYSFSLNPSFLLDLEQKYSVESVCLSGETAVYNHVLCPGLSYIQTTEIGLFVLDEIGLEIGDDICGVRDIWALILGCNTWGSALDNDTAEKMLISLFKP